MRQLRCAVAILAAWLSLADPAHAMSVVPLYLDEMIDTAAVAFEGRVVANRTERDPATNLVVTYTTFEVRDVLKGSVGARHEIKQVGGAMPDGGVEYRVQGVPRFEPGSDYVVFLAGVSSQGFSSPIGLSQGRFGIRTEMQGRRVANGRDFRDMTARMGARIPSVAWARIEGAQGAVRDMDLEDFKQAVRNHVGSAR